MDYEAIYSRLMDRARQRLIDGYVEKHHILPKCLGGDDSNENLVILTAREHFVAHQLLVKIYPSEPKLIFAAKMMCSAPPQYYAKRSKNRLYEWLRKRWSEAAKTSPRKPRKKETKPRNRIYVRTPEQAAKAHATRKLNGYTHSEETKRRISETNKKTKAERKALNS